MALIVAETAVACSVTVTVSCKWSWLDVPFIGQLVGYGQINYVTKMSILFFSWWHQHVELN